MIAELLKFSLYVANQYIKISHLGVTAGPFQLQYIKYTVVSFRYRLFASIYIVYPCTHVCLRIAMHAAG